MAKSDVKPEPHSAPRVPLEAMVVYELDVPAFTSSLEVPQHHRGKLMGVLGEHDRMK